MIGKLSCTKYYSICMSAGEDFKEIGEIERLLEGVRLLGQNKRFETAMLQ